MCGYLHVQERPEVMIKSAVQLILQCVWGKDGVNIEKIED